MDAKQCVDSSQIANICAILVSNVTTIYLDRLTADVTSCIAINVEYCTGDVKFEYNSFKEVVLANIELACQVQAPPCDPIDLNHIGSCFVPGLLATEDLGLTRDVDTGVVSLDRDVLCR
jgi:hypothetical protein